MLKVIRYIREELLIVLGTSSSESVLPRMLIKMERSVSRRRCAVRHAGGIRSANADISNDKGGEKPPRRKRKVFYATFIGVE